MRLDDFITRTGPQRVMTEEDFIALGESMGGVIVDIDHTRPGPELDDGRYLVIPWPEERNDGRS